MTQFLVEEACFEFVDLKEQLEQKWAQEQAALPDPMQAAKDFAAG